MKKSLAVGVMSLAMVTMPVFSAFAEELPPQVNGDETYYMHEAIVGEVDETVYSVDISWGDMTFDWKYDAETNDFNFQPKMACIGRVFGEDLDSFNGFKESFGLYSDNTCETELGQAGVYHIDDMYYYKSPDAGVYVKDFTVNGRVNVGMFFTNESKYMWSPAKVGNWSIIGVQEPGDEYPHYSYCFDENTEETLHLNYDNGTYRQYIGYLVFEKNSQYDEETMRSGFVSPGDKIGNVVITISPDYN